MAYFDWTPVEKLARAMSFAWQEGRHLYICGNGGSAANAIHLANDYLYGISREDGIGMRVTALTANPSVITCLANDEAYDKIFSAQLKVLANPGDLLLALSGSGNSPNIVDALRMGNELDMRTFAILGFSGGICKRLAGTAIHFPVSDMQVSEDLQQIVGHMLMKYLAEYREPARLTLSEIFG